MDRCHRIDGRRATRDELLWLHDAEYVDKMASLATTEQGSINEFQKQYEHVYMCKDSYEAALVAAGSSMEIVDNILSGQSRSGVGVIRPPGHHAECDEAYGFCIFNNTALAAKYALEIHQLERYHLLECYR